MNKKYARIPTQFRLSYLNEMNQYYYIFTHATDRSIIQVALQ